MESLILDFCNRYYEPQITQSTYQKRSIEEMRKLQNYIEFLDFGQTGFQRNKLETPSGLKNIGNTCYFNVFVQLLFHINSIRDLFLQAQPSSELMKSLKQLFAKMLLSSLKYSDPTAVFNELKRGGMQVGQQYDFHQYLSITLDTLQKCLSSQKGSDGVSQDRYINRIFFGKMNQYFNNGDTLKRSVVKFGVINLDAKLKTLEEAFDAFRTYEIEGYKSQKGENKIATIRSEITQFPAILTFFVNRVEIHQGRLVKNNIQFSYPNELNLDTDTQIKSKISHQQQQIENKILRTQQELKKQEHKNIIESLMKTMNFLNEQEAFQDLQAQNHTNFGILGNQQGHKATKDRLQSYINKLNQHDSFLQRKIEQLKSQKKALSMKQTSFQYTLFALMIHEGTANSGHYYIIIKNQSQNKWWKFSDRNAILISPDEVHEIASGKKHKTTNVCCIFYKQKQFICDPTIRPSTIQASLKSSIIQSDNQTIQNIKNAKINSMLRGCSEIAEQEIQYLKKFSVNFIDYFSQQKYYAIASKLQQTAKFAIFKQLISEVGFVRKLVEVDSIGKKTDDSLFQMPLIRIESIPENYYNLQNIIKIGLWIQSLTNGITQSLQLLYTNRTSNKQVSKYYDRFLNIVLLKSCYRIDVKINKGESIDELIQLILNILEEMPYSVVRSQILQNISFSLKSVNKKLPILVKKQIKQPKIEAYKVPYVEIRSILNRKFKIWAQFQNYLQQQGKTISQDKRTSVQSLEMVKDLYQSKQ